MLLVFIQGMYIHRRVKPLTHSCFSFPAVYLYEHEMLVLSNPKHEAISYSCQNSHTYMG